MHRRQFLAGAGAVGATGLAGCSTVADVIAGGRTGEGIEQRTVDVLDSPDAGTAELAVPVEGSVTVVDLFATWCGPCKPTLDTLAEARTQVGSDVRFVSITSEVLTDDFTESDVLAWWDDHGGPWTVAHAPASVDITRHLDARSLPTTIVTDGARREVWRHTGIPGTETLLEQIETARK